MKITSVDIFLLRHVGEEFSPSLFVRRCAVSIRTRGSAGMVKPAFP